jgi:DNA-binding NtrC family response regulator
MSLENPNRVPGSILVVDDDRSARLLLEHLLSRAGHTVAFVQTAEEALVLLAKQRFDLLITDKNLPGIDGLEVVRAGRERWPHMRTLLITGFPTNDTRALAEKLGVRAYVTKPFGVHAILELCDLAVAEARSEVP